MKNIERAAQKPTVLCWLWKLQILSDSEITKIGGSLVLTFFPDLEISNYGQRGLLSNSNTHSTLVGTLASEQTSSQSPGFTMRCHSCHYWVLNLKKWWNNKPNANNLHTQCQSNLHTKLKSIQWIQHSMIVNQCLNTTIWLTMFANTQIFGKNSTFKIPDLEL
jgi:hypothetical protein